jgi:hypothetical protein
MGSLLITSLFGCLLLISSFFNIIVIISAKICCLLQDKDKDKEFKVDWRRVGITSSFGFAFVGPVGHYWLVPVF